VSENVSAPNVPSPYHPCTYTCTDDVVDPAVNVVDSVVQPAAPGVQSSAVTPVPVAPM
jgi:hypothetical protein